MRKHLSILVLLFAGFICVELCAGTPVIAVKDKALIDFGDYPANEKKTAKFELVNNGDAPLEIKQIRKTCGCSETKLDKKTIQPGATAILEAEIKANSIGGPYSKAIYVESNDPKQRFLRLTLSGKAIPLIKVYPKDNLYLGALSVGKSYDYAFKLETVRDGVKVQAEIVKANFPAEIELKETKQGFDLKVKAAPDKKENLLNAEIEIKIISPSGWPPVKLKLQGRTSG